LEKLETLVAKYGPAFELADIIRMRAEAGKHSFSDKQVWINLRLSAFDQVLDRGWAAVQIALDIISPRVNDELGFGLGLNTFRDH